MFTAYLTPLPKIENQFVANHSHTAYDLYIYSAWLRLSWLDQ